MANLALTSVSLTLWIFLVAFLMRVVNRSGAEDIFGEELVHRPKQLEKVRATDE